MTRRLLLFFFLLYTSSGNLLMSQTQWRAWISGSVEASISPKLDLRATYLRSHNMSGDWANGFNQKSLTASYDLSKRWSALAGVLQTSFPSGSSSVNRTFLRIGYRLPLAGILTFSNNIQGEWHSAEETRFRNRIILISRIGNRKRIPFLRLNLSASYWLYYNLGGNPIKYYDASGAVLTRQSPEGFHRGRFYLNASSKLSKHWSLSLYYMNQTEFNLLSHDYRKINVVNPATGKTTRAFDNYQVAGLTLGYEFKTYKQKRKSKSNNSKTDKEKSYEQQN